MQRLGPDTVHREGRRVIVQSPSPMPDWKVSSFRRTEVIFEDERFFVAEVGPASGRRTRYVLEPWPPDLADRPSRSVAYDEEYVRTRDAQRSGAWVGLVLWPVQTAVAPLLGCLWSRTKRRLERRLGLNPNRATLQALFCQYLCVLLLGVLTWLSLLDASIVPGVRPLALFATAMALLADAVMRYDHLQDHPEDVLGIGEWLARRGSGRRSPKPR